MAETIEIAIIGAGPGGLGAATQAAVKGVSHVLFEKREVANTIFDYQLKKFVMAEPRKLPLRGELPFEEGTREEILDAYNETIQRVGVDLRREEVTAITKQDNGEFEIVSNKGSVRAKQVVLAIGLQGTPRKPGVPGDDLPHVAFTLADPGAFNGENVLVVGAGDSAIENALALAENNSVSILNRSAEFPRAKDRNAAKISEAVESGKIRGFYNSTLAKIEEDKVVLNTPEGETELVCSHVICRIGAIMPRKFIESCGIEFPSSDMSALPVVDDRYESNVKGLFIIGALIGYPLIKQAQNQGYEVVEHILGNPVEPADQVLIDEKLEHLPGGVKENFDKIRKSLRLFADLSTPQFRELITESTVHVMKRGDLIFEKDDHTDTFFNVIEGSAAVEISGSEDQHFRLQKGNFFGEMGLISGRRRTATVRAYEDSWVLETSRKQILKLINSVPSIKTAIDQVFFLRALKTSIFPDADPRFLAKLVTRAETKEFKKGDTLFREGDPGDSLCVILKGSVKISRRNSGGVDIAQTYLPAGNYVGEMSLLGEEEAPRTATVTAAVPCETIFIAKEHFQELLEHNPDAKERIVKLAEERRIENLVGQRDAYSGQVLDFVLSEGVSDAENVLLIDSDLCIGCDNCEKACAATHNGYSRLDRKGGQSLASIQVPISCRHCENPLCMLDCPPDALVREPNGEVIIRETCIGCGNCESNCPYGVIQMVYDKPPSSFSLLSLFGLKKEEESESKGAAKAAKCDMCSDLYGGPACVRSCPTGAAMRMNPSQMMKLLIDKGGARVG